LTKILFITSTRVGDAVLSTGLLNHLIETHPEARFTVACGPAAAPLFEATPRLDRLIVLHKMVYSLHWLGLWASCVTTFWDQVIDLRHAPLNYLLPARKHRRVYKSKEVMHRVPEMAAALGLRETPPAPVVWSSEENDQMAARVIPDNVPVLAIGPTANWKAKTWPPEFFADLAKRLCGHEGILAGGKVAVFGLDEERPAALPFLEALPEDIKIDLMGQATLPEIHSCLKRSSLYIGNDSGLMHIAAASGVPTLGLFGPSREELYAPWGEHCAFVRTPQSFETIHPEGVHHRDFDSLMSGLTVERVERAANGLWAKTRRGAP